MSTLQELDKLSTYLDSLSARYGREVVFRDFLEIVVCTLSMGREEERFHDIKSRYEVADMDVFTSAFAALIVEMDNEGKGLKDVLGDYFQEHFYNERLGQFFTPTSISDLMSAIVGPSDAKTIHDPCVGSGRQFLSHAKSQREKGGEPATYIGADISEMCCLITLINMCLNGLKGMVLHADSLRLEVWRSWTVVGGEKMGVPFVVEHRGGEEIEEVPVSEVVQEEPQPLKRTVQFRRFAAV